MKAIVTGHSRGLGSALAAALLARGISVLGLARSGNADLQAQYAGLSQHAVDLSDPYALRDWLSSGALEQFVGNPDTDGAVLLVNNAASAGPLGLCGTLGHAAIAAALTVNVAAPLMLSERLMALPGLRERRIMHISSGASIDALPAWSTYCASKAALDQHARCIALERQTQMQTQTQIQAVVRIASVLPGVIDTPMQSALRHPDAVFPLQDMFVRLHDTGLLQTPASCARRLVALLLHDNFGAAPVLALGN